MPSAINAKPGKDEYASYYGTYIGKLPDRELLELLSVQLEETCALLRTVPDAQGKSAYAPGKWSVKEVAGHMIDTERIMAYRLLRVSRGDATPLPGFEQDDYVRSAGFNDRTLASLIEDLRLARASTLSLLRSLDETALQQRGVANGFPVSARALAYIIAGHERHHLEILRNKYHLAEQAASSRVS
jgi:DinB superfamily